jgi:hypothetical protein
MGDLFAAQGQFSGQADHRYPGKPEVRASHLDHCSAYRRRTDAEVISAVARDAQVILLNLTVIPLLGLISSLVWVTYEYSEMFCSSWHPLPWMLAFGASCFLGVLPRCPQPNRKLEGDAPHPGFEVGTVVLIIPGSGPTDRDGLAIVEMPIRLIWFDCHFEGG